MKTTAEEKLMRSLEKMLDGASETMSRAEFLRAKRESHGIAQDVIRTHRRMIQLWAAMDKRMQKRAHFIAHKEPHASRTK